MNHKREGEFEFHEAANIFPLDEEHLDELANDIRKNGQQVAIILLDGKILDGRRRYLACRKANIKPRMIEEDVADPLTYVLSLNLHRRQLTPTQLSMVGARARKMYDEQAKARQQEGRESGGRGHKKNLVTNLSSSLDSGKARDHAARAVGVSGMSIDYATKVLNTNNPNLIAAVDADLIAVSTAFKATTLSTAEQDALVERAKATVAAGQKRRPRPAVAQEPEPESNGELRGVGVFRAQEAIDCLRRIPKNDVLRKLGHQMVADWLRHNK